MQQQLAGAGLLARVAALDAGLAIGATTLHPLAVGRGRDARILAAHPTLANAAMAAISRSILHASSFGKRPRPLVRGSSWSSSRIMAQLSFAPLARARRRLENTIPATPLSPPPEPQWQHDRLQEREPRLANPASMQGIRAEREASDPKESAWFRRSPAAA
jgi:hypothetical protein